MNVETLLNSSLLFQGEADKHDKILTFDGTFPFYFFSSTNSGTYLRILRQNMNNWADIEGIPSNSHIKQVLAADEGIFAFTTTQDESTKIYFWSEKTEDWREVPVTLPLYKNISATWIPVTSKLLLLLNTKEQTSLVAVDPISGFTDVLDIPIPNKKSLIVSSGDNSVYLFSKGALYLINLIDKVCSEIEAIKMKIDPKGSHLLYSWDRLFLRSSSSLYIFDIARAVWIKVPSGEFYKSGNHFCPSREGFTVFSSPPSGIRVMKCVGGWDAFFEHAFIGPLTEKVDVQSIYQGEPFDINRLMSVLAANQSLREEISQIQGEIDGICSQLEDYRRLCVLNGNEQSSKWLRNNRQMIREKIIQLRTISEEKSLELDELENASAGDLSSEVYWLDPSEIAEFFGEAMEFKTKTE